MTVTPPMAGPVAARIPSPGRTATAGTIPVPRWPDDVRVALALAIPIAATMFIGMAIERPELVTLAGVASLLLAVAQPPVGLTLLAIMIPLREPELFAPIGYLVVLTCATLIGCIIRLPVDRPAIHPSWGFFLVGAFLLYSVVTLPPFVSGFDPEPTASAVYQFLQLAGGVLIFTTAYLIFGRIDAIPVVVAGTVGATIAAILGIHFLAAGSDDAMFRGVLSPFIWVARAVGTFGNSNYFGLFLALSTLTAVGLLGVVGRRMRIALLPMVAILGLTMILTFSRGAVLALVTGLVAMAFLRSTRLGLVILAVAVLAVAVAYPLFIETRFDLTLSPRSDPNASLSDSDASRLAAFEAGFDIFARAPIFGIGFGQYQTVSAEILLGTDVTYPHNAGIKVLAEQGIVGVVAALVILVLAVRAVFASRHPLRGTAIAVMAAYAVGSAFGEPFWTIQTSGLMWILLAAVLAPVQRPATIPAFAPARAV